MQVYDVYDITIGSILNDTKHPLNNVPNDNIFVTNGTCRNHSDILSLSPRFAIPYNTHNII